MIKANDLRIGNNFKYEHEVITLYGIEDKSVQILKPNMNNYFHKIPIDRIEPIELTEEILLKCGFELKGIIFRINNGFANQFDVNYSLSRNVYYYDSSKYGIYNEVELKYLHQLQNLYFALTNKELNIKL